MKFEKPELTVVELVSENITVDLDAGASKEQEEVD